jgi:hypothetical protein
LNAGGDRAGQYRWLPSVQVRGGFRRVLLTARNRPYHTVSGSSADKLMTSDQGLSEAIRELAAKQGAFTRTTEGLQQTPALNLEGCR